MKRVREYKVLAHLLLLVMVFVSVWSALPVRAASTTDLVVGQEYYLTSVKFSGRAVNMYVDTTADIKNKTTVNLYALDKSATQRFTFTKNAAGNYLMIPRGSKYTVNVSSLSAGTAVFAWENKAANNEYFIIEKTTDGYYTLRMENSTGLYLTADSNTKLTLRAKASDNSQKFAFHAYPETASAASAASSAAGEAAKAAETLAVPVIKGHEYYITSSKYGGKAINMSVNRNSAIKNNTKVNLYALDKSETQRFTFTADSTGTKYLMIPRKTKYTVNVTKLADGAKVIAYANKAKNNEYLVIRTDSSGYTTFQMAGKANLYLSAKNKSTLTLKSTKTPGPAEKFILVDWTVQNAEGKDNGSVGVKGGSAANTSVNGALTLQVKHILQTKGSWASYRYDSRCKDKSCTIRKYGCTITCCTMIYNYMNNTTYNPKTYAQRRLKFDGNGGVSGVKGSDWGKKFVKKYSNGKFTCQTIKAMLDKGTPVLINGAHPAFDKKGKIIKVYNKKKKKYETQYTTHWVVAYGYKNSAKTSADILIRDPNGTDKTLDKFLKRYYTKAKSQVWEYR